MAEGGAPKEKRRKLNQDVEADKKVEPDVKQLPKFYMNEGKSCRGHVKQKANPAYEKTDVYQVIENIVPNSISLAKEVGQHIMVRKCYVELETLIEQEIAAAVAQNRFAKLIIAGTPAVGKSMMLCYFAGKLPLLDSTYGINGALIVAEKKTYNRNKQDEKHTAYTRALFKWNGGTYDFCKVFGCDQQQLEELEAEELRENGYITMMDGASYLPLQHQQMGHVIIFSSPAIDVPDQRQHRFVSYYMPVWGDNEFEKLLELLPTCQEKTEMEKNLMRKAHKQLGGTVGNIFVQDLQKQVDEILQVRPVQLANLCQTMTGLSENKLVEQGKYKPGWYRYITNGERKKESEPQQDLKSKYTLASLDYISPEFKEIVEYAVEKKTSLKSHKLLGAIKEAYGGFGGQIYEEEIRNSMTPSQFSTERNLKMVQIYPQYKEKNWHQGGDTA